MSGHTSGLGKGFAMIALIALAIIGIASLVGIGIGSLTGSPFITASLAALCPVGAAYLLYQSKGFSLYLGFSGLVTYFAASATFAAVTNSFFAFVAAAFVAVVVFAVVVFAGLALFNGRFGDKSWRTKD